MIVQAIEALAVEIRDSLTAAGVTGFEVTREAAQLPGILAAGLAGVFLPPPTLTAPTYHQTLASWEIWILAPDAALIDATARLDPILSVLLPDADEARPDTFAATSGPRWPGYVLTLQTEI